MENKIQKSRTNKCINNKRKLGGGFLGFGYTGCWAVNKPTTIEDESGKTNPNEANIFPRKNTMNLLVVLFKHRHLKFNIHQVKRLDISRAQRLTM